MDLKKVSQLNNLGTPEKAVNTKPVAGGPSFEETLKGIQGIQIPNSGSVSSAQNIAKANSATATQASEGIKFSNHAVERMQTRGISFNKEDLARLNEAVDRAAAKGSKDTLVLMNDSALICSVKNKTVVTVMDKTALKENVFTNIDSTIVM